MKKKKQNTEYIASTLEIKKGNNGLFSLSNKRNLITIIRIIHITI